MRWIQRYSLYFAWTIALAAMLGSLYYGEVLRFEPCRLCWYQRLAMFPLAFFLGVAFYHNELKIARYCLPIVGFGALIAGYQSLSGLFPSLQFTALCGEGVSCTVTGAAPYLSFIAFSAIGALIFKNDI